ncbi:MAG: hypothetical protein NC543_00320 [bacterium]|nr:hypothetical protein [bacterium]MCM1375983.1 hypothetical protein [Muribaculum sp.]
MLSVILNWIYIIVTAFCTGYVVAYVVEKKLHYHIQGMDSILMAGVVVLSVYAQTFSLFYKVGALTNGVLLAACIVILFFLRRQIVQRLGIWWRETSVIKKLLIVLLFLLWAYYTSRGVMHFDTDLYHAQCIRWIEEYGVVPGLGNLHERFAYNSSYFPLSALYSMEFLVGRSMHTMSGFFALLLSMTILRIVRSRKKHCFTLSGFARASAIYYLTTIVDEVISPATDYPVMCVIFFVVIKWLDLLEEKKDTVPYSLLCVTCVYALSLKLTAGVILLLVLKPAFQLIRERRIREIVLYLGLGMVVVAPWLARTVIISGWLLYPFPKLDLFQVDWKMDAVFIEVDAAQISAWGKALYDIALLDKPVMEWMPNWFIRTLSNTEKLLVLGNGICVILFLGGVGWTFVKKRWEELDMLLVLGTLDCCYLFWQLSAPLMRYGYAYVLLVDFVTVGWLLIRLNWVRLQKLAYYVLILYGMYKAVIMGKFVYDSRLVECYIWQADYGKYELESYEIDGYIFYKPSVGALTGYELFPAAPTRVDMELRGDDLKDGFRRKQKSK